MIPPPDRATRSRLSLILRGMRNFISELRRRNVLRVAAAYALSAWIIIEAGSVLLPTFGAPEAFFKLYVIVVIAGFVVSVILAWIFEITPEGVKLDRKAERPPLPGKRRSNQRMNYLIIALLVVALTVSITFNVSNIEKPVEASVSSIAVLPFRSDSPDSRVFADGIHDDLLTRLANIKALKVISRTSVMEYRDTLKNVRIIAEELGVESVLEGSVQRTGDNVRINLNLIDARTDEHIWAKAYDDRLTMENIFAVQSEIAASVADALQATLSPAERVRVATVPTSDLRAYRLYKEGKDNLYRRQVQTLRVARRQFEEAIALDPEYAEAHAGLAEAILLLTINHQELPPDEAMSLARASIDRALQLDPNLADAYALLGLMKSTVWGHTLLGPENAEAEAAFRRAIALNPNHASAHMWFASLRDSEDRLDEAVELFQRAMELDPLARIPASNLPMIYAKRGEHEAAMRLWLEATRIHNDWPTLYQYIAVHLWGLGRLDEAYAWYSKALELGLEPGLSNIDGGILIDLGELEKAAEVLDRFPVTHEFHALGKAIRALIGADYAGATEMIGDVIEQELLPGRYLYDTLSDSALLAGDLETARKYTLLADPILGGDRSIQVNRRATRSAVKLAYIEQQEGNAEEARDLLNGALEIIREMPRLGTLGFGIRDVQIYALLGRKEDAIAAFREALDAGYRGSVVFDGWPLEIDPYLDSIRDDPRFTGMVEELDGHLAVMRDRLFAAEAAGNLEDLRARTEKT